MASTTAVPPRTLMWEGVKVTAPGGDLKIFAGVRPSVIWDMFQTMNTHLPPSVYRKVRSCLTEVYIGYLEESKRRRLLSSTQASEAKMVWKTSPDWQVIEQSNWRTGDLVRRPAVPAGYGRLDPPCHHGHYIASHPHDANITHLSQDDSISKLNIPDLFLTPPTPIISEKRLDTAGRSTSNGDAYSGLLLPDAAYTMDRTTYSKPQINPPYPNTIPATSRPKKRKLDLDSLPPIVSKALAGTAPASSLSRLSCEESSTHWLNYNLRSVLEAHPPSLPKDPKVGHAVNCARPYLLSLKTRLDWLLVSMSDEVLVEELRCASKDLETAWGCLSIVDDDDACYEIAADAWVG